MATFTERSRKFKEEARKRDWSEEQIEAEIDKQAEAELIRTGVTPGSEIKDPSEKVKAAEGGIDVKEAPFKEGEVIDRTKEYVGEVASYATREEAMSDFETFKPTMEKEGVNPQDVLDAINSKFPEEEDEEDEGERGSIFRTENIRKIKGFFEDIFRRRPTEEERKKSTEFGRGPA